MGRCVSYSYEVFNITSRKMSFMNFKNITDIEQLCKDKCTFHQYEALRL